MVNATKDLDKAVEEEYQRIVSNDPPLANLNNVAASIIYFLEHDHGFTHDYAAELVLDVMHSTEPAALDRKMRAFYAAIINPSLLKDYIDNLAIKGIFEETTPTIDLRLPVPNVHSFDSVSTGRRRKVPYDKIICNALYGSGGEMLPEDLPHDQLHQVSGIFPEGDASIGDKTLEHDYAYAREDNS